MKVKRSAEKLTVQELEEEVNLRMPEPEDKETPYVVDAVVQVWCSISVSSMHFRNYFVFGILYIHFVFCRFVFNTNGAFIYIISFYVNKNFV